MPGYYPNTEESHGKDYGTQNGNCGYLKAMKRCIPSNVVMLVHPSPIKKRPYNQYTTFRGSGVGVTKAPNSDPKSRPKS